MEPASNLPLQQQQQFANNHNSLFKLGLKLSPILETILEIILSILPLQHLLILWNAQYLMFTKFVLELYGGVETGSMYVKYYQGI